jgi:hypothetical protein
LKESPFEQLSITLDAEWEAFELETGRAFRVTSDSLEILGESVAEIEEDSYGEGQQRLTVQEGEIHEEVYPPYDEISIHDESGPKGLFEREDEGQVDPLDESQQDDFGALEIHFHEPHLEEGEEPEPISRTISPIGTCSSVTKREL